MDHEGAPKYISREALANWSIAAFGQCYTIGIKLCATRVVRRYAGPALIALWFLMIIATKISLYRRGVVIGDLYIYANAIANTHLLSQFLYIADYQLRSGTTTLLLDHIEPSSVLLIPWFRLFNSPVALLVLQGIMPAGIVLSLLVVAKRFENAISFGWAVAVCTLYDPLFVNAVIEPIHGFDHDSQYLLYAPLFLTFFVLKRPFWTFLFLALFLGVKEDAAFFGVTFGIATALLGLSIGEYRRFGLTVAVISLIYFVATVGILPHLVASPNEYADDGLSRLQLGVVPFVRTIISNFFVQGWHKLLFPFSYAAATPALLIGVLPDVGMYSAMLRSSKSYYNFAIISFLAIGVLLTLIRLRATPEGMSWARLKQPVAVIFAIQIIVTLVLGLLEFERIWRRSEPAAIPVAAADKEAAWHMVDLSCSVTVTADLLDRFYHLPYWFQYWHVDKARYIVVTDRSWMRNNAMWESDVQSFVENNQTKLDFIGRSGPVTVWRNREALCLPWNTSTQ